MDTTVMPVSEIVRHTLIRAIVAVHRHVFGVFFWFLLPFGPAGAVLYRTAEYIARTWSGSAPDDSRFCARFAQHAFWIIDWLPVRLSALSFAIVGNFEEAMHNWRQTEQQKPLTNQAILIAAGSGALGICLDVPQSFILNEGAEIPLLNTNAPAPLDEHQSEPSNIPPRALQSAAGLGWRAVVLWMILLLIVTLSVWFG
jgi:adenosylcobinamide-phosphate synthase